MQLGQTANLVKQLESDVERSFEKWPSGNSETIS